MKDFEATTTFKKLPAELQEFYYYDKKNNTITWDELESLYKADLAVKSLLIPAGDLTKHIISFIEDYHIMPVDYSSQDNFDITKVNKTDIFRLELYEIDVLLYKVEDDSIKDKCDCCKESINSDVAFKAFYIKLHYPLIAHKIINARYCSADCAADDFLKIMGFETDQLTIDHSAIRNSYIHFLRDKANDILPPSKMTITEMEKHYKFTHEGNYPTDFKQLKKFAELIDYKFDKNNKIFIYDLDH